MDSTTFIAKKEQKATHERDERDAVVSNRDGAGALSYRMLDFPDQAVIAQVDDKGFLSSGSLTGISSLLITSQETFGFNQTLILALKVGLRARFRLGFESGVFWVFEVKSHQ